MRICWAGFEDHAWDTTTLHRLLQITLDVYSVDDNQAEAGLIESYALPDYGTPNGTPQQTVTLPQSVETNGRGAGI